MRSIPFSECDPFSPIKYSYSLERILCQRRGQYGEIQIAEHNYFGKMLILNGVVQLTERDEYLYHEMLAHVPLHSHPNPSNILIIGGGDGGTLREVLKHRQVKKVLVAEIDSDVIKVSIDFLPSLSSGFSDPRTEVVIKNGAEFISQLREVYDIILIDCTDPIGPAESLFTIEFLKNAYKALKVDGILAAQTESLHFHLDFVRQVQNRLKQVFPIIDLYTASIATYAGNWWTFSIASKQSNPREPVRKCDICTRFYADDVHHNAFIVPSLYSRLIGS
ncbi:polyamine aminopropyltransferase [Chloroflexota bacterium]